MGEAKRRRALGLGGARPIIRDVRSTQPDTTAPDWSKAPTNPASVAAEIAALREHGNTIDQDGNTIPISTDQPEPEITPAMADAYMRRRVREMVDGITPEMLRVLTTVVDLADDGLGVWRDGKIVTLTPNKANEGAMLPPQPVIDEIRRRRAISGEGE